ncbi:MAG: right-handed parallel beta-helix repeat-containing protein, partial [Planctomycetes bacterium]|nr:right-handed parallel beta-helix repeat-containing protein [Planctomycetota bacterium]
MNPTESPSAHSAPSPLHRARLAAGMMSIAASLSAVAANPVVTSYVDQTAPAGGDGTSWETAFRDLQDALSALNSKVAGISPPPQYVVKIARGTYKPDHGTKNRDTAFIATLGVSSAVSISLLGSFGGRSSATPDKQDFVTTRTVLSGDLNDDDLSGFANTGDNSELLLVVDSYGAGIHVDSIDFRGGNNTAISIVGYPTGVLPMSAVTLTDAYRSATINVTRCNFQNNQSRRRSGALLATSSQLVVAECTFLDNRTEASGGAIWTLYLPSVQLDRCVFIRNQAASAGGGVSARTVDINNCIFDSNVSGYQGGGAAAATWTATSSLFVRNRAAVKGGGIAGLESFARGIMRHCTLAHNQAGTAGALSHDGPSIAMSDSVAWNNISQSGPAIDLLACTALSNLTSNLLDGGAGSVGAQPGMVAFAGALVTGEPRFIAGATGPADPVSIELLNYRLRWNSSAVAASVSTETPPTTRDLDGNSFPSLGHASDLGCYFNNTSTCLFDLAPAEELVNDADFEVFAAAYDTLLISSGANPSADFNRDG